MMRRATQRLEEFLFSPGSDTWLGFLRVGVGLQVIIYCFSLRRDWLDLFAIDRAGVVKRDLAESLHPARWLADRVVHEVGRDGARCAHAGVVEFALRCGPVVGRTIQSGSSERGSVAAFVRGEKQQRINLWCR